MSVSDSPPKKFDVRSPKYSEIRAWAFWAYWPSVPPMAPAAADSPLGARFGLASPPTMSAGKLSGELLSSPA